MARFFAMLNSSRSAGGNQPNPLSNHQDAPASTSSGGATPIALPAAAFRERSYHAEGGPAQASDSDEAPDFGGPLSGDLLQNLLWHESLLAVSDSDNDGPDRSEQQHTRRHQYRRPNQQQQYQQQQYQQQHRQQRRFRQQNAQPMRQPSSSHSSPASTPPPELQLTPSAEDSSGSAAGSTPGPVMWPEMSPHAAVGTSARFATGGNSSRSDRNKGREKSGQRRRNGETISQKQRSNSRGASSAMHPWVDEADASALMILMLEDTRRAATATALAMSGEVQTETSQASRAACSASPDPELPLSALARAATTMSPKKFSGRVGGNFDGMLEKSPEKSPANFGEDFSLSPEVGRSSCGSTLGSTPPWHQGSGRRSYKSCSSSTSSRSSRSTSICHDSSPKERSRSARRTSPANMLTNFMPQVALRPFTPKQQARTVTFAASATAYTTCNSSNNNNNNSKLHSAAPSPAKHQSPGQEDLQASDDRPVLPAALWSEQIASFLRFGRPLPNMLYAFGGRSQRHGPLSTVEMFDTWHGRWVRCPQMPVRRAGGAATILPDSRLAVTGGYNELGIAEGLLTRCDIYDPIQQRWAPAGTMAPLLRARWGHGTATLRGKVYVVGGCSLQPHAQPTDANMETLSSCEIYDPEENRWTPSAPLQIPRSGARIVALNGDRYLAAVGGCDDVFGRAETQPTVELFDVETGVWTLLTARLAHPRSTAGAVALGDKELFVVGGAPSLQSAELYHVRPPLPQDQEGQAAEAAAADVGTTTAATTTAATATASDVVEEEHTEEDSPDNSGAASAAEACVREFPDMLEGRMGCQAALLDLPEFGGEFPMCKRRSVVVVGGERCEEVDGEFPRIKQFKHIPVLDVESGTWRTDSPIPDLPMARTAIALCVGLGHAVGGS